jgi:uncharacterized protein YjeT (DUF2065 family)
VKSVEILGLVAVCLLFVLGVWPFVVWRQRRVLREAGGLPVAVRRANGRWAIGVGQYVGDELLWYRTLSLSPGVASRFNRADLQVVSSRPWDASRDMALRPNTMVVECLFQGELIRLGFPDDGLTGFLSWLEASAPRF